LIAEILLLLSLMSIIDEASVEREKCVFQWKKNVKCLRCKSSARRRDRMKEHYQPSSSINLISSGWKERERKRAEENLSLVRIDERVEKEKKISLAISFLFFFLRRLSTNQHRPIPLSLSLSSL
jgi:hypothetical protein